MGTVENRWEMLHSFRPESAMTSDPNHRGQMALAFAAGDRADQLTAWVEVNPGAATLAARTMATLRPHESPKVFALDLRRLLKLGANMSVIDFLQILHLLEARL